MCLQHAINSVLLSCPSCLCEKSNFLGDPKLAHKQKRKKKLGRRTNAVRARMTTFALWSNKCHYNEGELYLINCTATICLIFVFIWTTSLFFYLFGAVCLLTFPSVSAVSVREIRCLAKSHVFSFLSPYSYHLKNVYGTCKHRQ